MPDGLNRAARACAARRACAALSALVVFIAGGDAAAGAAQDEAASSAAAFVTEAAPGVFVHAGRHEETARSNLGDIANIGFVVGERCVAVVDTGGSLAVGRALAAAVRRTTERPVCYVINTHMHPDHVFGNAAFAGSTGSAAASGTATARFVGAASLPAALAARAAHYEAALRDALGDAADGSRILAPDLVVEDRMTLDLGGRTLVLQRWPTAHTDNDLTVLDEASGTLWLGDLLFDGRIPSIDGSVRGWLALDARLRELPARRVVPGHGRIAPPWPAALDVQSRYLARVAGRVRDALAHGRTLREAVEAGDLSDADGWALAAAYHRRNLTAAYAELEWE